MSSVSSVSDIDMSSDSDGSEDSPEMALPAAMVLSGLPKDQFTGNLQTVFTQGSVLLKSPRSACVLQTQASSRPSTSSSSSTMATCTPSVAPSSLAPPRSAPSASAPSTSGPSPSALSTDSSLTESGIASSVSSDTEKSLDYYLNVINKIEQKFQSNQETEHESDADTTPPKKKICSQRKTNTPSWTYKFENSWLNMPIFMGWLEQAPDADQDRSHSSEMENYNKSYSYCKICKIRILSRESVLRNHAEKLEHKQNVARLAENVNSTFVLSSISTLTKNIRRAELKLCGLIATHYLPFSLMDTLTPLIQNILPDSEIAKHLTMDGTKCTGIITDILGKYFLEKLYSKLREPGCFFSLLLRKVTDKHYALAVRYYDIVKCNIVTNFFDIVEVEGLQANELFNALKKSLADESIPLSNLVAFSSDCSTTVMAVSTLLKDEFPKILYVNCPCHMTLLATSRACLKLPRSLEELVRDIGSQLSRSPARNDQLRKFQLYFKTGAFKRSHLSRPCWLALHNFVAKIVEQFEPLKAYIRELVVEDATIRTVNMLSIMKSQFTKIYLEFLSYVLGLFTNFDSLFQSNKALLHKVKPETARLLKTICSNFIEMEVVRNNDIFKLNHNQPDNFVELEDMYIGIAACQSFESLTNNSGLEQPRKEFLNKILEFYIDLVTNIKRSFVFDDPVYDLLLLIEPSIAQSFQETSLKCIIDHFPILKNFVVMQKLDNEWRHHALLDFKELNLDSITDTEDYWKTIFQMKNVFGEELFPNLKKVVSFQLILASSNSCDISVFDDISKIRSNRPGVSDFSTLKAMLASKQGIEQSGGCLQFEPESDMINCNIWHRYE